VERGVRRRVLNFWARARHISRDSLFKLPSNARAHFLST
jgi:hypothetical protein